MKKTTSWTRAPGELLGQVRNEMDQLMQRFFGPVSAVGQPGLWAPEIDVEERSDSIVIKADLPGVDPNDIEVAYAEGSLILRGERKEDREETRQNYRLMERAVGRFYRAVPLPAGVDADTIQAVCARGVLTITVPKKPSVQERKITVYSGDEGRGPQM